MHVRKPPSDPRSFVQTKTDKKFLVKFSISTFLNFYIVILITYRLVVSVLPQKNSPGRAAYRVC